MIPVRVRSLPLFPRPHRRARFLSRLTLGLCAAGLPALAGCAQFGPTAHLTRSQPSVARAAAQEEPGKVKALPESIPAPRSGFAAEQEKPQAGQVAKVLPISLDTVFRLAEDQNAQVALARVRVREAYAEKAVAALSWLPAVYVGTGWYRHEGGIQNENGTLQHSSFGALFAGLEVNARLDLRDAAYQRVNAERRVWQQKGELTRISNETLLDAAGTYIDLLAVRTGEAIALGTLKDLEDLHSRAKKLAATEPGAKVELSRIQAALSGRKQFIRNLQEQARAASAKLVYLLGLDPCTELVPIDEKLVPIDLVDATPPVCDLVAQALAQGPGVREMEGLLALIHDSMARSGGMSECLPVVQVRMVQGGFGAGPGSELDWDNRWDLGVQIRWNLTEHVTKRDRKRITQARIEQAHLAYQDLRGKLTLGVQASREAVLSGKEQLSIGDEQVKQARQAYNLSYDRLKNNIAGSSPAEVLLQLQALGLAQADSVRTLAAHNRAQLRLLMLLGESDAAGKGGH